MRWLQRLLCPHVMLPDDLVTPEWLQSNLAAVNLLDARFAMPNSGRNPATDYAAKHIVGAVFFDIEAIADKNTSFPHMLPTADEFAIALSSIGFDPRQPTVIYDDGSTLGACRCWWMLRVFGIENTALLDGGLPAWEAAGLPVTNIITAPARTNIITPQHHPERVWTLAQVHNNLAEGSIVLVDARAAPRFKGEQSEPRAGLPSGHIPGSLNVPFNHLLDNTSKKFKSNAEIQALLAQAGLVQNEAVVATCGSGVSACVLAFAFHRLGQDIPVYDGSWAEWGSTTGCPIMLGPAQRLNPPAED